MKVFQRDTIQLKGRLFMNAYIKSVLEGMKKLDDSLGSNEERGTYNGGFFVAIPNIIRRCHFIDGKSEKVLYELLSYMRDNTFCSVYQFLLADHTNLSPRSVSDALNSLEQLGIIKKVGNSKDGDKLSYQLNRLNKNNYLLLSDVLRKVNFDTVQLVSHRKKIPPKMKARLYSKGTKAINELIKDKEKYLPIIQLMEQQYHAKIAYEVAYKEVLTFLSKVLEVNEDLKQELIENLTKKEKTAKSGKGKVI